MGNCLPCGIAIIQLQVPVSVPRLLGFLASQVAAATRSGSSVHPAAFRLPSHGASATGRDQEGQLGPDHPLTWPQTGINPEAASGSRSVGGEAQCIVMDRSCQ